GARCRLRRKVAAQNIGRLWKIAQSVQVKGNRNDIGRLKVNLIEAIELASHRHYYLAVHRWNVYAFVRRNESRLCRTIERIVREDARTGSGARRHVLWPDRTALRQIADPHTGEGDVGSIGQARSTDCRPRGRVTELEVLCVDLVHHRLDVVGQVRV